jgi:hypothetical protein
MMLGGCADQAIESPAATEVTQWQGKAAFPGLALGADFEPQAAPEAGAAQPGMDIPVATKASNQPRKIIYSAQIELSIDDVTKTENQLRASVQSHGGYVSSSDVFGAPGTLRRARWTIRVPVSAYESFLVEILNLGELERRQSQSQDVSEEFYDVEARLKNKRVEETRLVNLLESATAALDDVLAVEKELSRVREEIERYEGRIRFLADQADFTTITMNASERRSFAPQAAPTFGTKITRRFQGSVDGMLRAGENALLAAISVLPWLPVWIIAALALRMIYRRIRRRLAPPRAPVAPVSSA